MDASHANRTMLSLFAAEKDLTVVGEADDGVAATAEIHAKLPDTRIVVLTSYSTSDTIAAALAAGAVGAIMKSADDSTLLTAIRVSP